MTHNLTPKQEAAVEHYALNGFSDKSAAYRHAYNAENMKPETIHVKANQLFKVDKVAVRVEELREKMQKQQEKKFFLDVEERKKVLSHIATYNVKEKVDAQGNKVMKDPKASSGAIDLLNKMENQYPDQNITVNDKTPRGMNALYALLGKEKK